MKGFWSGQLSAAKTGWLVVLLFFGWLTYLLVPVPEREPVPAPPPVKRPPSRLVALGLPDNPDLDAMPEIFAMYADKAEWENNRTKFAYWNPASNSYSYFFEAIRKDGKIRFHTISISEACRKIFVKIAGTEGAYETTGDSLTPSQIAAMDLFSESATHPFVFFLSGVNDPKTGPWPIFLERPNPKPVSTSLIELKKDKSAEAINPPPPELKLPSLDLEQKK